MAFSKTAIVSLFLCGAVFCVFSVTMLIVWPSLFFKILKNQLILTNSSKSFEMWKETPIPMYLDLFLYNISNADEMLKNKSVKPYFVEMGPYVFREHHSKVNLSWHENGTIRFWQQRFWYYEPEMSNGSLSDEITNINVIALSAAEFSRNLPLPLRIMLDATLHMAEDGPLVTRTAGELLFEGYDDKLVDLVNSLNIPSIKIPYDKFGWFYGRNESVTYDGVMDMYTGQYDSDKLGILDAWNYVEKVPFYDGECGRVKGGTGELFPPQYKPDNVTVFATDICSAVTLKRSGDITIEGITGSLFSGDDSVFDNGWNYTDEKCFCTAGSHCAHYGARDVSKCKLGAPAYISFPHFYLADPYYLSKVDGITPDSEKDQFQMGLEIYTGIPVYVRAQLQINLYHDYVKGISFFKNLPDKTYYPTLWFRQEVKLTEEYASQAKIALLVPVIVEYVLYVFVVLSLISLLVSIVAFIKRKEGDESRLLLPNNTNTPSN